MVIKDNTGDIGKNISLVCLVWIENFFDFHVKEKNN